MELGTLLVKLSADSSGFARGVSEAAAAAEIFSKRVKKISGDIANVGLAMTAFGGAMTALAATVDGSAKKSLDGLKEASALVAVQIADILEPAVRSVTDILKGFADIIAGLSPELKGFIADFGLWAAVLGTAGMALSKLAGAASAFFAMVGAVGPLITAPVAGFLVVLASLLALIPVLVDNWSTFSNAYQTSVQFMAGLWDDFVSGMKIMWDWVISKIAGGFDALGFDEIANKMKRALSSESLAGTLKGLATSLATSVGGALQTSLDSWKRGATKTIEWIKSKTGGFGLGDGKARAASGLDVVAARGEEGASLMAMSTRTMHGQRIENTTSSGLGSAGWKQFQEDQKQSASAMQAAVSSITSKMGEFGGIINSVIQGAQAGGAWGALIAAIMEIVARMKSFTNMLGKAMDAIGAIADFVDMVLGPMVEAIGYVFQAISESFKSLVRAGDTRSQMGEALYSVAQVLDTRRTTAGMSGDQVAIAGVESEIAAFEKLMGVTIETLLLPSQTLAKALDETAESAAKLNDKLSESLTNVPTGVKIALARFNATNGDGVPGMGTATVAPVVIENVHVNAASGQALWAELMGVAKSEADLRTGNGSTLFRRLRGAT